MRLLLVMLLLAACDEPAPAHAAQARPMDEARAQRVIAATFQGEGVEPEAGRTIAVSSNPVKLEVAATGHKFGVIWLTRDVQRELRALLPRHDNDEGSLVVLDGIGKDTGAHALALWESDYMTEDVAGEARSETEIAAEKKLERDVRDFLVKAKSAGWP